MFLLGTLVPLVALDSTARDIFQSLVGVIDLFGIYYAIKWASRPLKCCPY